MLPLIVVACVFAAIPVFYDADDREHRLIHYGSASKPKLQTEPRYYTRKVRSAENERVGGSPADQRSLRH